jgi:hypothetical protein
MHPYIGEDIVVYNLVRSIYTEYLQFKLMCKFHDETYPRLHADTIVRKSITMLTVLVLTVLSSSSFYSVKFIDVVEFPGGRDVKKYSVRTLVVLPEYPLRPALAKFRQNFHKLDKYTDTSAHWQRNRTT